MGWKIKEIKEREYTENVVDLMVHKIKKLNSGTQHILMLASCIGHKFNSQLLSKLAGEQEEATTQRLKELSQEGLILSYNHTYKFLHDKISETAYSLLPEYLKLETHLQIARILSSQDQSIVDEIIFDVVNQYNLALKLIVEEEEINQVQKFNFVAGIKAKSSSAFSSAVIYFRQANCLLSKNSWSKSYEETFASNIELAECEFLVGNQQHSEKIFNLILENCRTKIDSAKVYRLIVKLNLVAGNNEGAMNLTFNALQIFDIYIPKDDLQIEKEINIEMGNISAAVLDRRFEELYDSPEAQDPEARAVIGLLSEIFPALSIGRPNLYPLFTLKLLNYSLKFGNTSDSVMAYIGYSKLLIKSFRDLQTAQKFSDMSFKLNKKFNDIKQKGMLLHQFATHINFWLKTFSSNP